MWQGEHAASAQDDPHIMFCQAMAPTKQVAEELDEPGSALNESQAHPVTLTGGTC